MRWPLVLALGMIIGIPAAAAFVKQPISEAALAKEVKRAKLFEKSEKFEKAEKVYDDIFKKYSLTPSQRKKVREDAQQLNVQMFFSKVKTPGSFFYEVKKGDRLFDLSRKYNTTMELIKKSNQLKEDELLIGSKIKIIHGVFEIAVNKNENRLKLYFDKKLVKEYSVTTGANNKTPVGKYKIINKVENPDWYFGEKVIPAGSKKNMLGTRWMGFDIESYGIHGTTEPESIGRQASLGCVRMLNLDVEELYTLIPQGTSVTITD